MRAKRDYRLIVDGKYNLRAIIQKAWAYKHNPFCTQYRNDFNGALKAAWVDARLKMNEYKSEKEFIESGKPLFPNKNLSISDLYSDPFGKLAMGYVTR